MFQEEKILLTNKLLLMGIIYINIDYCRLLQQKQQQKNENLLKSKKKNNYNVSSDFIVDTHSLITCKIFIEFSSSFVFSNFIVYSYIFL